VPPRGGTGDSSTVMRTGSQTGRVDGPGVHEPRVGARLAACNREVRALEDVRDGASATRDLRARASATHRTRDHWWRKLWRATTPGEHRPRGPRLPRRGSNGTDPRGEQSFEAGVPFVGGEPGVHGEWTARAAHLRVRRGDRTSDREEPSSRPKGWRDEESDREEPADAAPDEGRRANPQGSNGPRERARLPGEGKLWRGSTGHRPSENGGKTSHTAGEGLVDPRQNQTGVRRSRIRGTNLTRGGPAGATGRAETKLKSSVEDRNPTREDRAPQSRATKV